MHVIERRQQQVLQTLWARPRLSRWEIHEQTGFSPNAVGVTADAMLRLGLIRECAPEATATRTGRPRIPLEIDPSNRNVLGLALVPGRADVARLGLTGIPLDCCASTAVASPAGLVDAAAALLADHITPETLAVGITSTGFIDPEHHSILFSSALPGRGVETLAPIFQAAGDLPAVLGNDMHAMAAWWLLTHQSKQNQDVLLVKFTDGRFGSAVLIDGRPNRGCVTGGNELGHTRLPVETERCFCGQIGCLERVVSTEFLHLHDAARERSVSTNDANSNLQSFGTLAERAEAFQAGGADPSLDRMMTLLATALSNAINFLRPHQLVLVSPLMRNVDFAEALIQQIESLILPGLAGRVSVEPWQQGAGDSSSMPSDDPQSWAANAGWLAMAELFHGGWDAARQRSG